MAMALMAATSVSAQPPPPGLAACQACHGPEGISPSPVIPNLAGQKAAYLEAQLKAFKAGARKNDLMQAIAGQLADSDIKAYADFWSGRSAHMVGGEPGTAPIASRMTLPARFPAGFTQYQEQAPEGANGVVKRYANAIALDAARKGAPLPPGSVIVTEMHDLKGVVSGYAAMESRIGWGETVPALLRNGDWDYALISPDGKTVSRNQAACLACHKPMASSSFVFTLPLLKTAAAKRAH
jgi:cytochrome c553